LGIHVVDKPQYIIDSPPPGFNTGQQVDENALAQWNVIMEASFNNGQFVTLPTLTRHDNAPLGTASADTLSGDSGDNRINGQGGNDTIHGGAGDDTLIGGTGNDSLIGGAGSDIYLFNSGDGVDTIYDGGTDGATDTVQLGEGITPDDVTVTES